MEFKRCFFFEKKRRFLNCVFSGILNCLLLRVFEKEKKEVRSLFFFQNRFQNEVFKRDGYKNLEGNLKKEIFL